jgi:hypothetical protein
MTLAHFLGFGLLLLGAMTLAGILIWTFDRNHPALRPDFTPPRLAPRLKAKQNPTTDRLSRTTTATTNH